MTELPTAAYPSHLSDGSLATDPWPGFDLHLIRSTPECSLIGALPEREVELGDIARQRTHGARAVSSAYSSLLPADKKCSYKSLPDLFSWICFTCVCVCMHMFCVSEASQSYKTGQKMKALAGTVSPLAKTDSSAGSKMFSPLNMASMKGKAAAITVHNENYCSDK